LTLKSGYGDRGRKAIEVKIRPLRKQVARAAGECNLISSNYTISPLDGRTYFMVIIESILGASNDPALAERLHKLEHHDALDVLVLPGADMSRRRLRARTEKGEEIAIALQREETLFDGAVLLLDQSRALVLRAAPESWLRIEAKSIAAALELGYNSGNLHWRVRFEGTAMLVALDAPAEDYLARLQRLILQEAITTAVVPATR
jgi:urease accessory protein